MCFKNLPIEFDEQGRAQLKQGLADPYVYRQSGQTEERQRRIEELLARNGHIREISIDPVTDTPAVLKGHAERLMADPARWTFLTGERDDIDQFAARFGLSISRSLSNALDITHNLRTVIVDGKGSLVKVHIGNQWTPDQVVADLKAAL